MRIGVSTHIHVFKPLNMDLLRSIRQAGFSAVELYANPPHWSDYHQQTSRREIAESCLEADLSVNSIHTPFFRTYDYAKAGKWYSISHKDPAIRRESCAKIIESIAIAEFIPVEAAVVHFGASGEREDSGTLERIYNSLVEILSESVKWGVTIALENIINEYSSGSRISQFISDSDLDGLGCCYDSGHAKLFDRTVEDLMDMASFLETTHIHDSSGGEDNHLLPFSGDIDWDELAGCFARTGYDGPLIVESKDISGNDDYLNSAAKRALKLLKMIEDKRAVIK